MISKRDVSIGFIIGVIAGCILLAVVLILCAHIDKTKFCPTCGKLYNSHQYYCDQDGDVLKESS